MTEVIGSVKPAAKINYGNSDKLRKEESASTTREPVKKIVTSDVIQKKKPLGRKIADTFAGDDAKGIVAFVVTDVLIPQAKDMINDAFSSALQRALYGDNSGRRQASNSNNRTRGTSYGGFYNSPNQQQTQSARTMTTQGRAVHNFKEIILNNRGEAEEVIDGLCSIIDQYKTVSVSDLYEMVGLTGEFTDQKWGWTDLRSASVSRVREGYLLDLPKTVSLD